MPHAGVRGGLCRAGSRYHACSPGGDLEHQGTRDRRGRTGCVWKPLRASGRGHPRRIERALSLFLDTDFICFLNLSPGRFFYAVTDVFTL